MPCPAAPAAPSTRARPADRAATIYVDISVARPTRESNADGLTLGPGVARRPPLPWSLAPRRPWAPTSLHEREPSPAQRLFVRRPTRPALPKGWSLTVTPAWSGGLRPVTP